MNNEGIQHITHKNMYMLKVTCQKLFMEHFFKVLPFNYYQRIKGYGATPLRPNCSRQLQLSAERYIKLREKNLGSKTL